MRVDRSCSISRLAGLLLALALPATAAAALEDELGRNEVRVRSTAFPLVAGRTVSELRVPERLERIGYRRVHDRPDEPGEYFWGHEVFWLYRRAHRRAGIDHEPSLIGLRLRRSDGMILGATSDNGHEYALEREGRLWIEPEVLSESLTPDRARRRPVGLDTLPEHVWRTVLAAEDARFFDHAGVDARSLARAALANVRAGRVAQGGSTITQQLIKNRELSPKRSLGRKLSEAARALALEAEYDKREILETYLDHVYLGHVDGLAIHGLGTAARTYFSKAARELSLAEAALLAGMIQGPNRLTPLRHVAEARERRNWVLGRMESLGWAEAREVRAAKRERVRLKTTPPEPPPAPHFLAWLSRAIEQELPARIERGRGVVVETTLDPLLQEIAERVVRDRLAGLRRDHRRLRDAGLSAALVALDGRTGEVLAYVGGDPAGDGDGFDHARSARRQPGSTVKPLVLLEAFDDCGSSGPLNPATRVLDGPLTIELPSGAWEPRNHDNHHRGPVSVRRALAESLNVPFARIGRACGWGATARTLRRAGVALPDPPPPSFVLGAVETTPLQLAGAFTVFATPGRVHDPVPLQRVERPGGRRLLVERNPGRRVVRPATAWVVRDLMREAVESGTARVARIEGLDVAAKTGTTHDAWFAGHAGSIVAVAWVGLGDGASLGLTGARAAGPIWRDFIREAVPARSPRRTGRPSGVIERWVDDERGVLVRRGHHDARRELFRRGALPPRDRFWRIDRPTPVLR